MSAIYLHHVHFSHLFLTLSGHPHTPSNHESLFPLPFSSPFLPPTEDSQNCPYVKECSGDPRLMGHVAKENWVNSVVIFFFGGGEAVLWEDSLLKQTFERHVTFGKSITRTPQKWRMLLHCHAVQCFTDLPWTSLVLSSRRETQQRTCSVPADSCQFRWLMLIQWSFAGLRCCYWYVFRVCLGLACHYWLILVFAIGLDYWLPDSKEQNLPKERLRRSTAPFPFFPYLWSMG